LLRYSENLVRSGSAMRCQEVPQGDTVTSGGRGNREPAKLAMRIADEHCSSARESDDGEPNPSSARGSVV